ncbi:MAG: glycosyltransferase family 1 protein [Prevotella sp.]|nr:glycosyltransferase family 1 protein [Prevotella sp.]
MKILLLGEYSNVHWTLAEGLRTLGHEVTVASNGDFWKNYPRDIDLARKPTKIGGIRLLLRLIRLLPKFKNYDIVQLINPMFVELKAERIRPFYNFLRRNNRRIVLGAFGMDYYWVSTCINEKPLRYSDFNIGDELRTDKNALAERADWLGTAKERLNRHIADDCDGIVTGLYEYDVCYRPHFPEKTEFVPYPIVLNTQTEVAEEKGQKIRLFIGINRERSEYKGTDIMLRAAREIARKYPEKVELKIAESVPFAEYQHLMDESDAILDQLYAYTPAMNALLAMSKGIICVGGGEPENYEIIGETELRPIVNVGPTYESVFHELEQLVLHPERIPELQRQSVEYIRRHHDHLKVARQYEKFYEKLLNTTKNHQKI